MNRSERIRYLLVGAVACIVLGFAGWFVYDHVEASWEAVDANSEEASKNPMLGAERLLQHAGYRVDVDQTLSIALFQPLPNGTMILAEGGDDMLATQSQKLLAWVARGNTLIVSPGWRPVLGAAEKDRKTPPGAKPEDGKDRAAEAANDAISAHYGITLERTARRRDVCRPFAKRDLVTPKPDAQGKPSFTYIDCLASLTMPGVAHPLRIDLSYGSLVTIEQARRDAKADEECGCKKKGADQQGVNPGDGARSTDDDDDDDDGKSGDAAADGQSDGASQSAMPSAPAPILADDDGKAVRVYAHGRGRVVLLAGQVFDNEALRAYDHGELLLGLAALNPGGKTVTLIERIDIASWIAILWHTVPYALSALGVFLLLWAWYSVRRFGPQLPDPDDRRRAWLEHVEASGRWLWKSTKGREIMLAAMRRATERVLARRIPELRKLSPQRQVERLAADGKMARAELEHALLDVPGRLPVEFTRQIQSLQELRAHYER